MKKILKTTTLMTDPRFQSHAGQKYRTEKNFALEFDVSDLKSIPPGNFTHFWCRMAENLYSVFLTIVQPEPGIAF